MSSPLLKILCSLLNGRVQTHCSENGLINKNQIGFQKDCRTSDHILTLKTLVKKYVANGKEKLYVCFIDFKKAFDSVWHKGLFYKLHKVGINWKFSKFDKTSIQKNQPFYEIFNYYVFYIKLLKCISFKKSHKKRPKRN